MGEKAQAVYTISRYMNLLRIKTAKDAETMRTEVDNQLCEARAQLEALGVVAGNLVIK